MLGAIWKLFDYTSTALAAGVLSSVGIAVFNDALIDKRDPIVSWNQSVALNSPVKGGGPLFVSIDRTKIRFDCEVFSHRWAADENGKVFDLEERMTASKDREHVNPEIFAYKTESLPVGKYQLKVSLLYICPGDIRFDHLPPDVNFTVDPIGEPDASE